MKPSNSCTLFNHSKILINIRANLTTSSLKASKPTLISFASYNIFNFNYLFKLYIFLTMAKNVAQSPLERASLASLDQRLAMAKRCSHEGVIAGAKAAVVATIATAIPTLASVRMLPWARANLNHTAQALIISSVAGAAYFIVADKTVLATARKNSFNQLSKH